MTTFELIEDPERATSEVAWSRTTAIHRELTTRVLFAALPALLPWLRWGMLDRPRRRWYSPLPSWLATPLVVAVFFTLYFAGINLVRSAPAPAAGVWLPAAGILGVGLLMRSKPFLRSASLH